MTTPNLDFATTTQADLAENIVMPGDLGAALQDHSEERYAAQTGSRYPGAIDGTLAGSPIGTGVLGIVNKMAAKLTSQVANSDPADIRKASDLQSLVPGFFDLPLQDLFTPLLNALNGVGGGVLGGALSGIADLFSGRWAQVDSIDGAVTDLQDKTQELEGIIGHASAYMALSPGTTTSPARMPFTTQSGPLVGVENLGDGRWRLLSKGSWDISAQVEFWGGALMPPGTFMRIVTRDPSGGVYHRRAAKASSSDNVTLTNVTNIVVPAAGYTVEVEAWTSALLGVPGATFRGISGGFETTGLYIRKVSQETS